MGSVLKISPARIDHILRGYFGGLGGDIPQILDLPVSKKAAGIESVPLVNQMFRRGGTHARSRKVQEMYDEYIKVQREWGSMDLMRKYAPETVFKYPVLEGAVTLMKVYNDLLKMTMQKAQMDTIRDEINKLADDTMRAIQEPNIEGQQKQELVFPPEEE
jgi:hypothetical protein